MVREHSRGGLIPHVRLGRYVRYRREAVLDWIAEQEHGGARWRKHRRGARIRGEAVQATGTKSRSGAWLRGSPPVPDTGAA